MITLTWQKSTYSEEASSCVEIATAPTATIAREGERCRGQDGVEVVAALLRNPARCQVVHLVQEFETIQPVGWRLKLPRLGVRAPARRRTLKS